MSFNGLLKMWWMARVHLAMLCMMHDDVRYIMVIVLASSYPWAGLLASRATECMHVETHLSALR